MNSNSKDSCRDLLKKLCILPLHYQYIFSILLFVVKNRALFKTNFDVHKFNTRSNYDLHLPTAKLTIFQKGVCYSGIKISKFRILVPVIKVFILSSNYHIIYSATSCKLNIHYL